MDAHFILSCCHTHWCDCCSGRSHICHSLLFQRRTGPASCPSLYPVQLATCKQLPSIIVDLSLYYCCTAHQTLAALLSFVQSAVQEPLDRRAWAYAMLYVNLYGLQLLSYSARSFGHFFGHVLYTCLCRN